MHNLTFQSKYDYAPSRVGIEIPVDLRANGRSVRLVAKVDTGADFCIFQRDYADELGLDIEAGEHKVVTTVRGERFDVYGHTVILSCLDLDEFETTVYFTPEMAYKRNVVGRLGWLQHVRLALIDHDTVLYLSHYDE